MRVGAWHGRSMPAIDPWQLIGALLPHVRDPWPHSIGLGFPFTVAGAATMLAEVLYAEVPRPLRGRIAGRFRVYGFRAGVVIYLVSLLVQVVSRL
jgi:hypothetical protein